MENCPTFIQVVAAVIRDAEGRLLLQQCAAHKPHAGKWEFPGGKVENKETPRLALCREVAEELAIVILPDMLEPAGFADQQPLDGHPGIVLLLYTCGSWRGVPQALEGQQWGWFTVDEAIELGLPPMDRTLLEGLSG